MTVPGRVASARLLLSLDPPPWFLRHARAVAEVAAWLARRTSDVGTTVDVRLIEAAALLHDVDKLVDVAGRDGRPLPHGEGSAAWLADRGLGELGPAVAAHPVTVLARPDAIDAILAAPPEVAIVAYADKRAGQRLESMDSRFRSWGRRYPLDPADAEARADVDRMHAASERLEAAVCGAAAVSPAEVRRLAWTSGALAAARRARVPDAHGRRP